MNVLVTGCSRGVGLEIVKTLLDEGNTVYGIARSYTSEFQSLENKYPNRLFFKAVDLQNIDTLQKEVFKDFIHNGIPLDGLVNNAAMAYDDIVTNINIAKLEMEFKINVFSPMILTKYAIRNMLFNRVKGSIVHISSISTQTGYKGLAMYAASKGSLEAFSKNTAREWGEQGIRSNVVVPGFMETEMSSSLSPEQKDRIYKRTSMKAPTSIQSVAESVAFLLSDKAKSITGTILRVDNGTL